MGNAASCNSDELASAAAIDTKYPIGEEDTKYTVSRSSSCSWLSTRSSSEILERSPSASHFVTPEHPWSARRLYLPSGCTSISTTNNRPRVTPYNKILPAAAQGRASPPPSTTSAFPSYGNSASVAKTNDGQALLLFGGITGGSSTNDLFVISMVDHEPSLKASPIQAGGDAPSPRFGHVSACFGDDLIVWGGDTRPSRLSKENTQLDNGFYVFNRTTEEWSRVSTTHEPIPRGRYGHAACFVNSKSKFYIFGGQTEDGLLTWNLSSVPLWELVKRDGDAEIPSRRSGHTCIAFGQKIFLFGGKDKKYCYNDTWSFDASTSLWTKLRCTGFIPAPRESHAAALVNDNMYVFGGRGADESFLGDLGVFSITQRRWHTFRNMESSPSPRAGHAMVAIGSRIIVFGGRTLEGDDGEDSTVHVLDTSRLELAT